MRVIQFSFAYSANGLGRAWSNWMALTAVGFDVVTIVPEGKSIWRPVAAESDFVGSLTSADAVVGMKDVDAIIALKPRPGSYDRARQAKNRIDAPLILDIDDPDFEARYGTHFLDRSRAFVRLATRMRMPYKQYWLRYMARRVDCVTLSNPSLARWYGSHPVVPHCRVPYDKPAVGSGDERLTVAFVGTVRGHKGIDVLREAVDRASNFRLCVTDWAPQDARSHEDWVGQTSIEEGMRIVSSADVIAVPSVPSVYSTGQLPAKLVDAMALGKAIVASDVPPVRWGLGNAGLLVQPGNVAEFVDALHTMRGADVRAALGSSALQRAREMFAPDVVGRAFITAISSAASAGGGGD